MVYTVHNMHRVLNAQCTHCIDCTLNFRVFTVWRVHNVWNVLFTVYCVCSKNNIQCTMCTVQSISKSSSPSIQITKLLWITHLSTCIMFLLACPVVLLSYPYITPSHFTFLFSFCLYHLVWFVQIIRNGKVLLGGVALSNNCRPKTGESCSSWNDSKPYGQY